MKTHFHKSLVLGLGLLSVNLAYANPTEEPPSTTRTEPSRVVALEKFAYGAYAIKDQLKLRLAFENQTGQAVSVKIYDENERLVYRDQLNRRVTALKRNYDLSELGKGQYRMDIQCGDFTASNPLSVGVRQLTGNYSAYLSAQLKNGKMQVAFQNAATDVYVTLVDDNGAIHYSEHLNEANFARRYDLSRLRAGTYTMMVTCGNRTVEQTYVLK
ncbi:MAG: hypothetical protein MUC97_16115 [Bernardetiaceae bacterium]|jgi:hypothetical protein|nr:hypothetical protein [Bernardetiaceae bacterium]